MDLSIALAILVGGLVLLLIAGIPVAFALLVTGIAAFFAVEGFDALKFTGTIFWGRTATFQFLAAPLFVYMGFLLYESGMVSAMFRMINYWLGRMPGSLGIVALVSSGSFAAMSGSGSAAAATLGSVTATEMRKYGFDKRFMLGILNGGASLAPLISPQHSSHHLLFLNGDPCHPPLRCWRGARPFTAFAHDRVRGVGGPFPT